MKGTDTSSGSFFERTAGALAMTLFSACYYYSVFYICLVVAGFFLLPLPTAVAVAAPFALSTLLPIRRLPGLLGTSFFKCALKYHEFEEVLETSREDLDKLEAERSLIYTVVPHGVMSIAGICYAIFQAPRPTPPTCAASVMLSLPILKHVFGSFGLIDASSRSLARTLTKTSVVLYVGGMAEASARLFLSSPKEERLYIAKRKGFIKMAMRTGADVVPCYYFGNTTALEVVVRNPMLSMLSRKMGASITLLWGRWGLPIPFPRKVCGGRESERGKGALPFTWEKSVGLPSSQFLSMEKHRFEIVEGVSVVHTQHGSFSLGFLPPRP
ncbi:unnamed protein product [Discosporangium mesarthrocarpum]